ILPYLRVAKRGYVSKIELYKIFNYILYRLHTGCQWESLSIAPDKEYPGMNEISWWAVYYHFRKWSGDGSLEKVWQHSVQMVSDQLDTSGLNVDGSHAIAKKGGEAVAYQGRKYGQHVWAVTEGVGIEVVRTPIAAPRANAICEWFIGSVRRECLDHML